MEYTKGKWESVPYTNPLDHAIKCNGRLIATHISRFEDVDLIAAAPTMYEALKLYQEHQLGTGGHYCWECNGAINKAIAHAEGKGK